MGAVPDIHTDPLRYSPLSLGPAVEGSGAFAYITANMPNMDRTGHGMTSNTPPVLGIAAYSGTGKTTLLSRVIPLLHDKGLRVGLVKHAHHAFEPDLPGKDSHRLREAGAERVLVTSNRHWALFADEDQGAEPLLAPALQRLSHERLDLILVEGFKQEPIPKIELYRSSLGKPAHYPEDPNIIAVATDAPLETTPVCRVLDINDAQAVAGFVLEFAIG